MGRGGRLMALAGIALFAAAPRAPAAASPRCAPARVNPSQALAGSRVTASPGPGTRDSSAATQISLLGVPAAQLSRVTVTGSRSGPHPGRLIAYSQGDGPSFVPVRPFADGERGALRAGTRRLASTVHSSRNRTRHQLALPPTQYTQQRA